MESQLLEVLKLFVLTLYSICMIALFLFGLNSLLLSGLYLLHSRKSSPPPPNPPPDEWPYVTIQLPIFNERYMIQRLLKAVTELDYPADRLQVQVLDDSTDETVDLVRPLVSAYQSQGYNLQYVHRTDRGGFKAGALNEGLCTATGEFVAVFDADFVPSQNWLRLVIPYFHDSKVGFVQTRWKHLNDRYSLLTRLQSLALDGHFIVEQSARYRSGLLMGFNGSAGIWRRAAIEDAGGWQGDTLTEDLDLSYRAELKGWRPVYLPQVQVGSEVPVQVDAVKKQQYRWSKGTVQVFRKLILTVIRSDLPLLKKFMAVMHLCMYMPFPFVVLTLLLVLPVGLINYNMFLYFPFAIISSLGPPLLYMLASTDRLPRLIDRVILLPGMILFGAGISLNCSLAAIDGFLHKGGVFERTPKFNVSNSAGKVMRKAYLLPTNPIIWAELGMAIYLLLTLYLLWPTPGLMVAPWLLSTAAGYFLIAFMSIANHFRLARRAARSAEPSPVASRVD
ncbi:MAG TPA: cellulose synthase family protein [Anaerolineaceae bacterium]